MRIVAMLIVALFVAASTASAQQREESKSRRALKVIVGAGALVAGTAVAATSSKTTKVSSGVGTAETSEFSSSQLITGLVVAGTGGYLLWDGLHDRTPDRPSTTVAVGVGKRTGLFVRRSW